MEKFELVDKNGNGTGKILTYEETSDANNIPDDYYLAVVGVVIINDKNEVLLQKRSKFKKSNPNKWGICGGKVRLGEDEVDAGVRETFEEIGITLDKNKFKAIRKAVNGKCHYTVYFVRENVDINKCILQEKEVEELKYYRIEELAYLDTEGFEWLEGLKKNI